MGVTEGNGNVFHENRFVFHNYVILVYVVALERNEEHCLTFLGD